MMSSQHLTAISRLQYATLTPVCLLAAPIEVRAEHPAFATINRIGEAMNTVAIEGKAVGLCRKL